MSSPVSHRQSAGSRWHPATIILLSCLAILMVGGIATATAFSLIPQLTGDSAPACRQVEVREEAPVHYRKNEGCLPIGFPKDIPLVAGDVFEGVTDVQGASAQWRATLRPVDTIGLEQQVSELFRGAGWTRESPGDHTLDVDGLVFSSPDLVALVTVQRPPTGVRIVYEIRSL